MPIFRFESAMPASALRAIESLLDEVQPVLPKMELTVHKKGGGAKYAARYRALRCSLQFCLDRGIVARGKQGGDVEASLHKHFRDYLRVSEIFAINPDRLKDGVGILLKSAG